jgi:hypothetical protein
VSICRNGSSIITPSAPPVAVDSSDSSDRSDRSDRSSAALIVARGLFDKDGEGGQREREKYESVDPRWPSKPVTLKSGTPLRGHGRS